MDGTKGQREVAPLFTSTRILSSGHKTSQNKLLLRPDHVLPQTCLPFDLFSGEYWLFLSIHFCQWVMLLSVKWSVRKSRSPTTDHRAVSPSSPFACEGRTNQILRLRLLLTLFTVFSSLRAYLTFMSWASVLTSWRKDRLSCSKNRSLLFSLLQRVA